MVYGSHVGQHFKNSNRDRSTLHLSNFNYVRKELSAKSFTFRNGQSVILGYI